MITPHFPASGPAQRLFQGPTFIAWNTKRLAAIAVANLLFGWTGIGWPAILVWAMA